MSDEMFGSSAWRSDTGFPAPDSRGMGTERLKRFKLERVDSCRWGGRNGPVTKLLRLDFRLPDWWPK